MIGRRTFLATTALTVLAPARAGAATPRHGALPRIGVLGDVNPLPWTVRTALADLECRWAEGDAGRLGALAAELAALDVDVIVTIGAAATSAAIAAAPVTPIVFVSDGDADDTIVRRRHVTGLRVTSERELAGRRLDVLAELGRPPGEVAALTAAGDVAGERALAALAAAAASRGVRLHPFRVAGDGDLDVVLTRVAAAGADALAVVPDAVLAAHAQRLVALTMEAGLPAVYGAPAFVAAGGLVALYGDTAEVVRRVAALVARVLAGSAPESLPVETVADVRLAVGAPAARRLRLALSPSLLARADTVIA